MATRNKQRKTLQRRTKTTHNTKRTAKPSNSKGTRSLTSTTLTSIKKTGPIQVGKKPYTKSELIRTIAEQTGLNRKHIQAVLESMSSIINAHLKKHGPESFSLPGLFKIMVVNKPATPARWGVNPFTGEKMKFKAKPATRKVKIRPLKGLKEMATKAA
ncbi:MAG TPA: HU family DNA-binding protein [Gammaproteobacteria bacterium]|nr:HU family DNA-binding protein [Gammaproteobacteria bacterium]